MFWTCVGHVLDMEWICFGYVLDMFWICFGYVLDMCWIYFGYVLDMFRTCFGHDWDMFGTEDVILSCNILLACFFENICFFIWWQKAKFGRNWVVFGEIIIYPIALRACPATVPAKDFQDMDDLCA